jgi:hypothetical protein
VTLGTPALWAGSATHPVRVARNAASTYFQIPMVSHANSASATTRGGGYGVACGGDLAVTTTGGLGYSIAAGHFALPGTFATAQGGYVGYNDAAVTGTLPARDATNPYIAYICARVRDTDEDATGSEVTDFAVVQGTPAASPAAPAVPSSLGSLLILSETLVPSVANGGPVAFTERRQYLAAVGGIKRVTSALNPSGAGVWPGFPFYETDTGDAFIYDGTAKRPFLDIWQTYTPTWAAASSAPALGNGTLVGTYAIYAKTCFLNIIFTSGSSTNGGTGGYTFSLPPGVTASSAASEWHGVSKAFISGVGNYLGVSFISGGTTLVQALLPTTGTTVVTALAQNANASNTVGTGVPVVAGAYTYTTGNNLCIQITFPIA